MRYPTAPDPVSPPAPVAPAPLPYWRHPDWPAFLAAMREAPGSTTERLVAADWLEESGEYARAYFVRERASLLTSDVRRSVSWPIPGGLIRDWFSLGKHEPNAAQTLTEVLNYYPEGTEGDLGSPRASLTFFCGFADQLRCDALTLTRAMDDLYAREPVRSVNVFRWASAGDDGNPIIGGGIHDPRDNAYHYVVAGRTVRVTDVALRANRNCNGSLERARAECAFAARWPGVAFTVNI